MNPAHNSLLELIVHFHETYLFGISSLFPLTDPILIFGTVMTLLLLAPITAKKLHLPEIVGLILAGILFGPHIFGVLARDQTIELLGQVGLLYIMFLAGLEIDLQQIKKNKIDAFLFGIITFLIPLGLGTLLGLKLGKTLPASILLASMFSSHTLISLPITGKLGLTKKKVTTTAVGGTITTDTLALLILAIITGAAGGKLSWLFGAKLFLSISLYTLAAVVLIPFTAKWFFRKIAVDESNEFIFVLALTFMVAYGAHLAGLEPIIGAFLAGLLMNQLIPSQSLLMTRIHFTGEAIFIPFFLLSVGMLVDPLLFFSSRQAMITSIGMVIVAISSKYLAARIFRSIRNYSRAEGTLLFGLSVSQAAATLAAVLIGYNLKLFDEEIVTGTILMIAVTCFLSTIISQKSAEKIARSAEIEQSGHGSESFRILIPMGSRQFAKELIDLSFILKDEAGSAPIYPLQVVIEGSDVEQNLIQAENILYHSVVRSLAAKVPVTPLTMVSINRSEGILRAARDNRISMILLNWRPEEERGNRFGKTVINILNNSTRTVFMHRHRSPLNAMRRVILILPPYSELQRGTANVICAVKRAAKQLSAAFTVVFQPSSEDNCIKHIKNIKPSLNTTYHKVDSFLPEKLFETEQITADDWLIVVGSRRGEVGWRPSVERLPHKLAELKQENNISIVFPGTVLPVDSRNNQGMSLEPSTAETLPTRNIFRIDAETITEAIPALLNRRFNSDETLLLSKELLEIAKNQPVELRENVILLHNHTSAIAEQTVLIGLLNKPVIIEQSTTPTKIIIILLGHPDQEPAVHLKKLAEIASWVSNNSLFSILKNERQ